MQFYECLVHAVGVGRRDACEIVWISVGCARYFQNLRLFKSLPLSVDRACGDSRRLAQTAPPTARPPPRHARQ